MSDKNLDEKRSLSDRGLHNRIEILLEYLNRNLSGKEEAIRISLLSAIAGENILMLGPSGQDKIEVIRCIASAFADFYRSGNNYCFEYFLNESSVPDDLNLSGKSIAFFDDIWAGSPAVLNKLLNITNDSSVFVAAGSREGEPYKAAENKRFDALRESFALHVAVNTASNEEAFFKFISNANIYPKPDEEQQSALISRDDLQIWRLGIDKVELGADAKELISEIRRKSIDYFVSDFRWKKIVRVLKACAFLNGRNKVDLVDCSLIDYAIPNHLVEGILKQKAIDSKLDGRQHTQYKENIFMRHKYYQVLKASINDKKLKLEQKYFAD